MERDVPDLLIEQLLLGELPPQEEETLLKDPLVRERLEKLKQSDREILESYPSYIYAAEIEKRTKSQNIVEHRKIIPFPIKKKSRIYKNLPIIAAAAVLILAALPMLRGPLGPSSLSTPDTVRVKGYAPALRIYRENQGGAEVLVSGARVRENDLLQLSYIPDGRPHGLIFSIDGRGVVTLHYPLSPASSTNLETGREIVLPFSYQLDDAPEYERFFFITSDSPIPVPVFLSAAGDLAKDPNRAVRGELPLSGAYTQYSILLRKE